MLIPARKGRDILTSLLLTFSTTCVFSSTTNKYIVTEFPDPPGHGKLTPGDINNKGEIVFSAGRNSDGWENMFIYLPTPAYGLPAGMNVTNLANRAVAPRSINDNGQVVGSLTAIDVTPSRLMGFLWQNGVFQEFNFASSDDRTAPRAINNAGFMVGTYELPRPTQPLLKIIRAFVRTTNDFTILNPVSPQTNHTFVVAINNNHRVAGNYEVDYVVGLYSRGFWWDGSLTPVGLEPVDQQIHLEAADMNDSGEIVGFTDDGSTYLWLPAPNYGLPAGLNIILPPLTNGLGVCINNGGQVVTPNFLWDRGTITPMRDMLPAETEGYVGEVIAMNNHGQIVGFLNDLDEDFINGRPVLLSPKLNDPLIVNVASDDDDADPDDGIVDVDLNTPGEQVSLRAAINYANSSNSPGPDTIEFQVGAGGAVTISPTNALPPITEALTIDGSSQPGSGRVGVDGALAGAADALRLVTTNCVIKGLVVTRFAGAGLAIDGGSGHTIIGNIFGTDAAGATGQGNGVGLQMINSASNVIGGLVEATRNVFSGNTLAGVLLTNSSEIQMRANLVGTDLSGTLSRPNGQYGFIGKKLKRIVMGAPGVLSVYNSPSAVELQDIGSDAGTDAGSMINSYIGLSSSGTSGLGGTINGLSLSNAVNFEIGGLSRNVIAGVVSNALAVVNSSNINVSANYIGTSSSGNVNVPVGTGILAHKVKKLAIGLSNRLTVINGQTAVIIREAGSLGSETGSVIGTNASIINCNIGLSANGNNVLGGTGSGLRVEGGSGVDIGGAARNVFAGINSNAITVLNATNINILANYIGTTRSGNTSAQVGLGILADKVRNLLIGMTNQLTVINARQAAVLTEISGTTSGESSSSEMINCHVGLNAIGNAIWAGVTNGIRIERSSGFKIGGNSRNVFAGIVSNAITLLDSTNINLAANYIGTSSSGNTSLPVGTGIEANGAQRLLIGVTNALSILNARLAVVIRNSRGDPATGGETSSAMVNCYVGVNANGTNALGGTTNGVVVEDSDGFIVGGTHPSQRNVFGGISSNALHFLRSTNIQVRANYVGTDASGNQRLAVHVGIIADRVRNLLIGVTNMPTVFNATNMAVISKLSGSWISNKLMNCLVGVGANGTNMLGGTVNGLRVDESSDLAIGGETAAERMVFGGIASHAVSLLNSSNIQMGGTSFGADVFGQIALTNRGVSLLLDGARDIVIGNTNQQSVFGSSGSNAIQIVRSAAVKIQNAAIGMTSSGDRLLRVARSGIFAQQCTNLTVGGSSPLERVLVGGSGRHGIESFDVLGLAIRNAIIGSGPTATEPFSNVLSGVRVHLSAALAAGLSENATTIANSFIGFNQGAGLEFTQDPATVSFANSHILKASRLVKNALDGVRVGTNVASVTIGGTNLSDANEITHNGGSGVRSTSPGQRILVEINTVVSNVNKAIEVQSSITHQIVSAMRGSTHVQGNVTGPPNQTMRLHFYAHRPKAGAQGEGEMWVGSVNVPLSASGVGSYNSRLPRTSPNGWLVAATAADPVFGTAEFSTSQIVQNPTDTDADGLPDFWEALYPSCLDPLVADPPNEDCDGDGFTNLQEYIAHTDPTQADSALKVENLEISGSGATLEFTGVAGRQYSLERRLDLSGSPWVLVVTAIPEADGSVSLTDPNPPADDAFYRLVAEIP